MNQAFIMQQFLDESAEEVKNNYPIEQDDSFTPDQIEAILEHKKLIEKKISKNNSVLRGLETFFWGISSYSLCKWLILNLGTSGISLSVALAIVINQIVNRDCLDEFNLNRLDGRWETTGMQKLFKFLFGILASGFVAWSSIGHFIGMVSDSRVTYSLLNNSVQEFNSYSKEQKNEAMEGFVEGCLVTAVIVLIVKAKS
ncbi:MAG: hypothetical protein ACYTXE_35115 [Nostoc sp.]